MNSIKDIAQFNSTLGKKVIIMTASKGGGVVFNYLYDKYKIEPVCFCDQNQNKRNTTYNSYEVHSLEFILSSFSKDELVFIIASIDYEKEIQAQLMKGGIQKNAIYSAHSLLYTPLLDRIIMRAYKIKSKFLSFYYKIKNRKKQRVYVFTDSRGLNLMTEISSHDLFSSYVGDLVKKYNVDYNVGSYSHTTTIDFLYDYHLQIKNGKSYDKVIAHIGVVDFSPRPTETIDSIISAKKDKIEALGFDINYFLSRKDTPFLELYNNGLTSNLYSITFLQEEIVPYLQSIKNLIYIGPNLIVDKWKGSYWQDRPSNLNIIVHYADLLKNQLNEAQYISLTHWSEDEIKTNTVDNIHFSNSGMRYISQQLEKLISV